MMGKKGEVTHVLPGGFASDADAVRSSIDAYADWVRQLRDGRTPRPLVTPDDPLARLGRELEELASALTERERQLQNLLDIVQQAEHGVLLDDVLSRLFDGFSGVIPFERIGCAFLSEDAGTLVAYWARSTLGPIRIASGYSQRMRGSTLLQIINTGEPRIINDLPQYLASKPSSDSTRRIVDEGGRSSLTCPLIVQGRPLGFLFFTSARTHTYEDLHPVIFRQISSQVSVVIEKARMFERLVAHNTALVEHTKRLEVAASTDALTGLLNRRVIDQAIEQACDAWRREGSAFGLILADIDHFKSINDRFGHVTGDAVLREFAGRLRATVRAVDRIGRVGGEEFLVLLAGISSTRLRDSAERVRAAIDATPFVDGTVRVTASIGYAEMDPGVPSGVEWLRRADAALYEAKRRGRNRCVSAAASGPSSL